VGRSTDGGNRSGYARGLASAPVDRLGLKCPPLLETDANYNDVREASFVLSLLVGRS
jgi:hypothetical protein